MKIERFAYVNFLDHRREFHTARKEELQVGNPFQISIITMIEVKDAFECEQNIHKHFQTFNHRGEWLKFDKPIVPILEEIVAICK